MKNYLLLLFALFFTIASPADGNDRGCTRPGQLMLADPFILEHEGWYYIYGTEDADGIVVYRSRDLKNWSSRCGKAKKSLALHKDDVWGKRMFWAPEVYKHGDKFIMTYSSEEHTSADVPVFAYGDGAELFDEQTVENIQIPMTIASFMGVYDFGDQSVFSYLGKE